MGDSRFDSCRSQSFPVVVFNGSTTAFQAVRAGSSPACGSQENKDDKTDGNDVS